MNPVTTTLPAALRVIGVLLFGFVAILNFLTARDVVGLWVWLQTTDGIGFIAAIGTAATFAASMWSTWKHKQAAQ